MKYRDSNLEVRGAIKAYIKIQILVEIANIFIVYDNSRGIVFIFVTFIEITKKFFNFFSIISFHNFRAVHHHRKVLNYILNNTITLLSQVFIMLYTEL